MKWTWDKFGYIATNSSSSDRDPVRDHDRILALLNMTSVDDAKVHFFPVLGRAVVTSTEPVALTTDDLSRANRESHWGVEYYTESDWIAIQCKAEAELQRVDALNAEAAHALIQNGVITLDDVAIIPPERLSALLDIDIEASDAIIDHADAIMSANRGE
jgi:hypothetical protein